jgi:hypothetical protein
MCYLDEQLREQFKPGLVFDGLGQTRLRCGHVEPSKLEPNGV